jgi:hypothetical protein
MRAATAPIAIRGFERRIGCRGRGVGRRVRDIGDSIGFMVAFRLKKRVQW